MGNLDSINGKDPDAFEKMIRNGTAAKMELEMRRSQKALQASVHEFLDEEKERDLAVKADARKHLLPYFDPSRKELVVCGIVLEWNDNGRIHIPDQPPLHGSILKWTEVISDVRLALGGWDKGPAAAEELMNELSKMAAERN